MSDSEQQVPGADALEASTPYVRAELLSAVIHLTSVVLATQRVIVEIVAVLPKENYAEVSPYIKQMSKETDTLLSMVKNLAEKGA
jgi:hypothetical protein